MDSAGTVALVVMIVMMVVVCGGMIVGMVWGFARRPRSERVDRGAADGDPDR